MSGKKDLLGLQAFSLVELLVVIAVIAIIAAIAIPNIAGVTGSADRTKIRRNAQTIASTYNAAVTFGMTNGASDVPGAIAIISAGTNVVAGNTTNYFSVDGLSPEDGVLAQRFLGFSNGLISIAPAEE